MTFTGQPQQIPAFTAQRREHSLARRHLQPVPKLLEVKVDIVLVKADSRFRPAPSVRAKSLGPWNSPLIRRPVEPAANPSAEDG